MMLRLAVALVMALAAVAHAEPPSVGSRPPTSARPTTPAVDDCQEGGDHGAPYIYYPDTQCCTSDPAACKLDTVGSTYKRWTRECVAKADNQPFVLIGELSTSSLGQSGSFKYQTNSCYGNDFADAEFKGDNSITYVRDIEAKASAAGKPRPFFVLALRNDVIDAYDIGASDSDLTLGSFNRNWLMKTPRQWESSVGVDGGTGFVDAVEKYVLGSLDREFSGCRYPSPVGTYRADDSWRSLAGCAGTVACDQGEFCKTPYIMSGLTTGARQNAVYYIFLRDGASQKMIYASQMQVDINNPNYRAWFLQVARLRMAREHASAFEMNHKLHLFFRGSTLPANRIRYQPWFRTGDAYGGMTDGYCAGTTGTTPLTFDEALTAQCGARSGPPYIRATDSDYPVDTEFVYPMYIEGLQALGHLAYTNSPRVPYLTHVNPYWYAGCTAGVTFTAANGYTDASCTDMYDDPLTLTVNENVLIRQWVQEGGYVVIDRDDGVTNGLGERAPTNCSPLPCDGGMGSGSGSGLSSAQLKAMLEGGDPPAMRVIAYDSSYPRTRPPKIATADRNPWQQNPESQLTVSLPAECANGVDDDIDGLIDYPADTACASAAGTDETASASVACSDGTDNDSDGATDYPADGGCTGAGDASEVAQCQDGTDNEVDGLTDYPADPDCTSANDNSET